jgi:hypothetical protein
MSDITDSEMIPYREWAPTAMDPRGLAGDRIGRSDWLVGPVSITRDSEALSLSNWRVALRSLESVDPDGEDHEVHRFGHWGPGWFEVILIRPGTGAHREAWGIECSLADYPVLSDDDFSELEHELAEDQ